MHNFNKFALRLPESGRRGDLAMKARREARTRRAGSVLPRTSPDVKLDQQQMIDQASAAIGID
jgi:hypothetical protein